MLSLISGDSSILRCSPLGIADQVALPKKLKSYILLDASNITLAILEFRGQMPRQE